jgi:hypothetical protein
VLRQGRDLAMVVGDEEFLIARIPKTGELSVDGPVVSLCQVKAKRRFA